jgi:hypothetical protein
MGEQQNPDTGEVIDEYQVFYAEINKWQQVLDRLDPEDPELQAQANAAQEALDLVCPYIDTRVHIRGHGQIPEFNEKAERERVIDYTPGMDGYYRGVRVRDYQGPNDLQPRPQIMHMVVTGDFTGFADPEGYELKQSNFCSYFITNANTLIAPGRDIEEVFSSYFFTKKSPELIEQTIDALAFHSDHVQETVCMPDFHKFTHEEQQRLLEIMVNEAEDNLQIKGMMFAAELEYGYIMQAGVDAPHLLPLVLGGVPLHGMVLGLESLERLGIRGDRAIRSEEDLVDAEAGLCVALAPSEPICTSLHLNNEQALYLPISGQALKLTLGNWPQP